MRLGVVERTPRIKAQPKAALEKRPDVIAADGTAYEVVWYAHRDAASLLEPDRPECDASRNGGIDLVKWRIRQIALGWRDENGE